MQCNRSIGVRGWLETTFEAYDVCVWRGFFDMFDCVCQPLQLSVSLQHDAPCYQGQTILQHRQQNKQCLCQCPDHASVPKLMPAAIQVCSKQLSVSDTMQQLCPVLPRGSVGLKYAGLLIPGIHLAEVMRATMTKWSEASVSFLAYTTSD